MSVTVRYWAAARAAAGVREETVDVVGGVTLARILDEVRGRHDELFAAMAAACSVLVGERPTGRTDPAEVHLVAGDVVDLLPPFAGG